jgi:hypothetical protein
VFLADRALNNVIDCSPLDASSKAIGAAKSIPPGEISSRLFSSFIFCQYMCVKCNAQF